MRTPVIDAPPAPPDRGPRARSGTPPGAALFAELLERGRARTATAEGPTRTARAADRDATVAPDRREASTPSATPDAPAGQQPQPDRAPVAPPPAPAVDAMLQTPAPPAPQPPAAGAAPIPASPAGAAGAPPTWTTGLPAAPASPAAMPPIPAQAGAPDAGATPVVPAQAGASDAEATPVVPAQAGVPDAEPATPAAAPPAAVAAPARAGQAAASAPSGASAPEADARIARISGDARASTAHAAGEAEPGAGAGLSHGDRHATPEPARAARAATTDAPARRSGATTAPAPAVEPASPAPAGQPTGAAPDALAAGAQQPGGTPAPTGATAAAPRGAVPFEHLHRAVQAALELAVRNGIPHARLHLHPAELGAVEIHLRHTFGGLRARVTAESADAAEALQAGGEDLRKLLESAGVSVLELDIGAHAGDRRRFAGAAGGGFDAPPGDPAPAGGRVLPDPAGDGGDVAVTASVRARLPLVGSALLDVLA